MTNDYRVLTSRCVRFSRWADVCSLAFSWGTGKSGGFANCETGSEHQIFVKRPWFGWVLTWKTGDRPVIGWWFRNPAITTWDVKCLVNIGINYQPQLVSRSSSVNRSGDINMNKTFICPWPCCSPRHLPFWVAHFDEFFRISTVGWEMNTKLDS